MGPSELFAIAMVVVLCALLMAGYPVALTLGGVALGFAFAGHWSGVMDLALLGALPARVFGVMTNEVLIAIPLFVFMGVMLERSGLAEDLLETMGRLFGARAGGLAIAVVLVGVLLAAAKGHRGRDRRHHGPDRAADDAAPRLRPAVGGRDGGGNRDAGADFSPATVLILLGDQISNAFAAAQLAKGSFAPLPVTVSDLFAGAIVPALGLVLLYLIYLMAHATLWPKSSPPIPPDLAASRGAALARHLLAALVAPLALILVVLGSILGGIATPTESASIGAVGAMLLAARRSGLRAFAAEVLVPVVYRTAQITSMIFVILIGATLFSLVFRGLGGDDMVRRALSDLPGGTGGAVLAVMVAMFLLGFVMDAFEIIFVVVPIVAPALLTMPGIDPVWLGVMMALNLQTSYLHPPLGPTLFYLRGVAPPEITTADIYIGVIPFVLIQFLALLVLWFAPGLATWLPHALYGS